MNQPPGVCMCECMCVLTSVKELFSHNNLLDTFQETTAN